MIITAVWLPRIFLRTRERFHMTSQRPYWCSQIINFVSFGKWVLFSCNHFLLFGKNQNDGHRNALLALKVPPTCLSSYKMLVWLKATGITRKKVLVKFHCRYSLQLNRSYIFFFQRWIWSGAVFWSENGKWQVLESIADDFMKKVYNVILPLGIFEYWTGKK